MSGISQLNIYFVITLCPSSVIRLSTITKQSSPLKPLGQLRPNFVGMVLGRSTSKFVLFFDSSVMVSNYHFGISNFSIYI